MATFLALLAALAALAVVGSGRPPERQKLDRWKAAARGHDVRILRDTWGVPHVFGKTDADAAFGLAYAHAEDDFATIQGTLLAARGRLASVQGQAGAANDYMVGLLRIRETVDKQYATDLSPDVRKVCEAYAEGLNLYASLHPTEVWPYAFPARGQDVVAGFIHKLPLFFGLDRTLRDLFGPARRAAVSVKGPATTAAAEAPAESPYGSNAFAVGPARSADGFTRLAVNSHQPWDGPVAWYEASVRSEEGWDMTGGIFPGTPVILHGIGPRLGWAHTVNKPDLVDVYVLEINPRNPNQYRFEGEWRDLEVEDVPIDVKVWGRFHWTFHREALWSVQGPVVRRPHGTYAIRFAGMGDIRAVEQWFRMNKAQSRDEWQAAMRLQAVPMFNTVYADAQGHIGYVYNARIPRRAEGYDWLQYLPGDTKETLWTDYLPYDQLPQVWSPASGVVLSSNSSPFAATLGPGNPEPSAFPKSAGIETYLTNRARRLLELFGQDNAITASAFDRIKYDTRYSAESNVVRRLRALIGGPPPQDPLAREGIDLLRRWDFGTDIGNPAAALGLMTLRPRDDDQLPTVSRGDLVLRLEESARRLQERFGRLDVPFGEVHRLRRGELDLPVGGGPDTLRAIFARESTDGRYVASSGDSHILMATWDREGQLTARSITPYGSATLDRRSKHFADQAELFARGELKPVWRTEAEVRAHLEREYVPGDETR
jgi:penicillin amidase/acyl-homoserine-lactone acylase